jgi:hypothetical protein
MAARSDTVADLADDDPLSRDPHDYMVDLYTHEFVQSIDSGELEDAILVREKDFYRTPMNATPEEAPKAVDRKDAGDLDIALVYLNGEGELELEHYEFKETRNPDDDIPDPVERSEEQIDTVDEAIAVMNNLPGVQCTYDDNFVVADEEFRRRVEHPPRYAGGQYTTQEIKEKADESAAFEKFNDAQFDGKFWWESKIEEVSGEEIASALDG